MGWILFLEEKKNDSIPHAWPDASTCITGNMAAGYKLSCGDTSIMAEEVEHTNDFQQVMMWLHPEEEEPETGEEE